MFPIGYLMTSTSPAPEAPFSVQERNLQPATSHIYNPNQDEILISKYIKPTYKKPVKPFKIVRNIRSFQVFGFRNDNKTLVTGIPFDLIDRTGSNKFFINQLDMETGISQKSNIPSPGTNYGPTLASPGNNLQSQSYSSFLRDDNLIYQPFTEQNKPGLVKIFNIQSNSFIPIPNELTIKQDTTTATIRGGRGVMVANEDFLRDLESSSRW